MDYWTAKKDRKEERKAYKGIQRRNDNMKIAADA